MVRVDRKVVKLAEFARWDPEAGYCRLDDLRFDECLLWGPALVFFRGGARLERCNFRGEPETVFVEAEEKVPIGAIVATGVEMVGCRTEAVSFVGSSEFVKQALHDLFKV